MSLLEEAESKDGVAEALCLTCEYKKSDAREHPSQKGIEGKRTHEKQIGKLQQIEQAALDKASLQQSHCFNVSAANEK